jgi:hypothetical protein
MNLICLSVTSVLLLAVVISTPLFATGTKGGGNALICFKPEKATEVLKAYEHTDSRGNIIPAQLNEKGQLKNILIRDEHLADIDTIESFDLYEARMSIKGGDSKLIELKEDESPSDYIERLISRFDEVLPTFSAKMRNAMERIPLRDARFYPHGISPENDFTSVGLIDLSKCVLSSIFVQERVKNKEYLHLDERLFSHSKHGSFSRAVGYLHEIVYLIMRDQGDSTSDAARKIVTELIVHRNGATYENFAKEIISLGLMTLEEKVGDTRERIVEIAFQLDRQLREEIMKRERQLAKDFINTVDEVISQEGEFYTLVRDRPGLFRDTVEYQRVLSFDRDGILTYESNLRSVFAGDDGDWPYVEKPGKRKGVVKVPLSPEAKDKLLNAVPNLRFFDLASHEDEMAAFYQSDIYPQILQMQGFGENGVSQIDQYFRSKRKAYGEQRTSYAPRTFVIKDSSRSWYWDSFDPDVSDEELAGLEVKLIANTLFSDFELDAELPYPE